MSTNNQTIQKKSHSPDELIEYVPDSDGEISPLRNMQAVGHMGSVSVLNNVMLEGSV